MKGDDLENVCYLREDVPKNGMGSWVSHGWGPGMPWLFFFPIIFLGDFCSSIYFCCGFLNVFFQCLDC